MIKRIVIFFIVLINIGCDQISKNTVRKHIDATETIYLLNNTLILTRVENDGAMLGFGSEFSPNIKILLLQVLPILVLLLLLIRILITVNMNKWIVFSFACIIGGGIGNVIDRVLYDQVTDFFFIDLGEYLKTGIFNMADVSVTIGVLLILYFSFFKKKIIL